MKAQEISSIIGCADAHVALPDADIRQLLTDSRRLGEPQGTIFFAIPTRRNTGCRYVDALYRAGVRSFVVPNDFKSTYADANIWRVADVVEALQRLAAHHRNSYHIPVIGITGSNGKTVVKEWLVQMLSPEHHVVASPKSYNSQSGVPLSVWQMSEGNDIALFEAGISQPGEMERLSRVIAPTIGILTNIGPAHDENFLSRDQKLAEKLKLFSHCETLVCCADDMDTSAMKGNLFTWGSTADCRLQLLGSSVEDNSTRLQLHYDNATFSVVIPFVDRASRQNAMHCIATLLLLGYNPEVVAERCRNLTSVEMRMEVDEGVGGCLLVNDSYSLDMGSLTIALDYLAQQQFARRTLIMSDFPGTVSRESYATVAQLLRQRGVGRFVGIGPVLMECADLFSDIDTALYPSTDDFLQQCDPASFHDEAILLKGARLFGFERIARLLRLKSHETVMEVNLDALVHNLNHYRSLLRPSTKLMAMVKASSYGAGTVEVARTLENNHVDYLTVAYIDEGVQLRRGGIKLPIMVMNPEEAGFDDMIRYRLEPDIYCFRILERFAAFAELRVQGSGLFPIHIEFDTGMHRLGFTGADVEPLRARLGELREVLEVRSVFTHLACSEDAAMDDFTRLQIDRFRQWSGSLPGIKHILNSSGIARFPEAQMDMVRLGIGLYGVAPENEVQCCLQQVSRLVSRISQIKAIPQGDTVGYNRRWCARRPSRIAILTIGYADGLHRGLGNGQGHVAINGHEAPIVGSICMDMCFVDVTDVPCAEGDRAVIFGEGDLLQRNAAAAGTISYELLTAVAPRVKRVYYHE